MSKKSVLLDKEKGIQVLLSDIPTHYTPEFFSGRVQDEPIRNQYSLLRLCRFDIDTLLNALNCREHWIMTKEVGNLSSLSYGGAEQVHYRLELKAVSSLIEFLNEVRVVDHQDDEDFPL